MFKRPLIIFDCDGVLIDSEAIYLAEEFDVLQAKGVAVDKAQYVTEFMALAQGKWRAKFSSLIEVHTGTPLSDAEYDAMKLRVRTRIANEVQRIAGVERLLSSITAQKCVASSTSMQWLPKKLERTELSGFFENAIFSGDHVANGKPAPDLFLHAASQMGGEPGSAIVVEDSANGVRGGKAAQMFTIGFTGGAHCFDGHTEALVSAGADLVVNSHAALLEWLAQNTDAIGSTG